MNGHSYWLSCDAIQHLTSMDTGSLSSQATKLPWSNNLEAAERVTGPAAGKASPVGGPELLRIPIDRHRAIPQCDGNARLYPLSRTSFLPTVLRQFLKVERAKSVPKENCSATIAGFSNGRAALL